MDWRYLLIKEAEDKNIIIDIFKDLYGFIEVELSDDLLIIMHQNDLELDLIEVIESINSDIYQNIHLFESKRFASKQLLEDHLAKIAPLFQNLYFKNQEWYYNEKKLLLKVNQNHYQEDIKKLILKKAYFDKGLLFVIKTYLENNLNTSATAEALYMHRNTLINKIDKFIKLTNYDIRNFVEATIIYHLL